MYRLYFNSLTRVLEKESLYALFWRLSLLKHTFIIKKKFVNPTKIDYNVLKDKHFIPFIKSLIFILSCVVS